MARTDVYYHGKIDDMEGIPSFRKALVILWVAAMVPVFGVGMLGAWMAGDRLPLEGGVHTVIHTNKEVGKFTYVFTSVVADNIINGESTYTKGW